MGAADPRWSEVLDDFAAKNFDEFAKMSASERHEKIYYDGVNLTAAFVLRDARCWLAGLPSAITHEYLRVKLTDITAWAWGTVQ